MKYILLIEVGADLWMKKFSGGYGENSYELCMQEAEKLGDHISWMIVQEKRSHIVG